MPDGRVDVHRSKSRLRRERWHWRLVAANGDELIRSSEGYANRQQAVAVATLILTGGYQSALRTITPADVKVGAKSEVGLADA